jgi:EpsI family protein
VIAVGLASVALLPYTNKTSPVGIAMTLPNVVGMWFGDNAEVTQHEIDVLAKDTQFARKVYTSPSGEQIYVSIVLSGEDMTTSIHRPERCLPAQGWTLSSSDVRTIPLPNGNSMEATRLYSARLLRDRENRPIKIHNLNYYFFVGYNHMTASHLTRTVMDLRDRIVHGYDQRWAYVTVAANVSEGLIPGGKSEAETAAMIEAFMKELMPKLRDPNGASLAAN